MADSDSPIVDRDALMRRLRKLLAIAEDSRGDPNECAAAAAQAERIMRKYQIEHADLLFKEPDAFGTVATGLGENPFDVAARYSSPCGQIAVAVAKLYECQARSKNSRLEFCGLRLDAILARYTYLMLVETMVATCNVWQKQTKARVGERAGYLAGYASTVCDALRAAKAERDAEAARPGAFGALVVQKAALVRQHFGDPNYGRSRAAAQGASWHAGALDGRSADIGRRGVEQGSGAARIAG
jgi:hypothetical protein